MAYWVWILWTIRLFYLFLNSPLLKFDPLLYLHPNLSESGNEHEGTSSYDLGKWRTLPLSHQAQKYFVWHCFYVFFFCNKWDFEAYYWQKLWSASKVPKAVISFNCNLNGITNGKEKMEVKESSCKKSKNKNIEPALLGRFTVAGPFTSKDLCRLP